MNTNNLISTKYGPGLLVALELVLVTLVVVLSIRTNLLRDHEPNQKSIQQRAYSLAKSQLAFWTVIVTGGFIYVYFNTGKYEDVINNSALLLLGISMSTTALAGAAKPQAPEAPLVQETGDSIRHESFLKDILSDNEDINLHRLQMVIWTVVFGCVFIHRVVANGEFPKFDDQTYGLMGISSTTYVWFKRTEK